MPSLISSKAFYLILSLFLVILLHPPHPRGQASRGEKNHLFEAFDHIKIGLTVDWQNLRESLLSKRLLE